MFVTGLRAGGENLPTTDELAALAAEACGVTRAGVVLRCADGLSPTSVYGDPELLPVEAAELCARAVDARRLQIVTGDDGLLAAAPMVTVRGDVLGAVWVGDSEPGRTLTAVSERLLVVLADWVASQKYIEMLREQREHVHAMVGAMVFYAGRDGVVQRMTTSWEHVTGHLIDDTVGRPLSDFVQDDVESLLAPVFEPGGDSQSSADSTIRAADGSTFPVSITVRPLQREDGEEGALGVMLDLRERHRRELEARHDQKLESLGRLSAGIAHEINTPIQFVGDNTRFLASAVQEILDVIAMYRECLSADGGELAWTERVERAARAERDADVEYLASEIPVAVQQSLEGIDRVATLVRAMKAFSYKDSRDHAYADINEALTTTLTVARNEVKYVADVVLELDELPPVLCHIGDLNQVFLNLLVNAADALEGRAERGEIRITTRAEGSSVVVAIADNGSGIPADIQSMIFEPFFTTKEVGKGTGQGLALARNVVMDKHGGSITVSSTPGTGTEFVLRLPVDGKRAEAA